MGQTTQGEFGSEESILIDGGVKPDPPGLFQYSPEWRKFFLISMFCCPGLVEYNSGVFRTRISLDNDPS